MAVTSMRNSSIANFKKYRRMSTTFSEPKNVTYFAQGGGSGGSDGQSGVSYGPGGAAGVAREGNQLLNGTYSIQVGAGGGIHWR